MSDTLTKKEAMALLRISTATMSRWMTSGKIKFTKDAAVNFKSSVFFDRAEVERLLPKEPVIPTVGFAQPAPTAPEPIPAPESKDTRTWAEKFRDGDAPDSAGNYIDGANSLYPETGATLLGPAIRDAVPPTPKSGTSHMDPHLLSDWVDPNSKPLIASNPQLGEGFTRSGSPLASGYSQDKYEADTKAWRGGKSMSEQEAATRQAVSNINRSFPR